MQDMNPDFVKTAQAELTAVQPHPLAAVATALTGELGAAVDPQHIVPTSSRAEAFQASARLLDKLCAVIEGKLAEKGQPKPEFLFVYRAPVSSDVLEHYQGYRYRCVPVSYFTLADEYGAKGFSQSHIADDVEFHNMKIVESAETAGATPRMVIGYMDTGCGPEGMLKSKEEWSALAGKILGFSVNNVGLIFDRTGLDYDAPVKPFPEPFVIIDDQTRRFETFGNRKPASILNIEDSDALNTHVIVGAEVNGQPGGALLLSKEQADLLQAPSPAPLASFALPRRDPGNASTEKYATMLYAAINGGAEHFLSAEEYVEAIASLQRYQNLSFEEARARLETGIEGIVAPCLPQGGQHMMVEYSALIAWDADEYNLNYGNIPWQVEKAAREQLNFPLGEWQKLDHSYSGRNYFFLPLPKNPEDFVTAIRRVHAFRDMVQSMNPFLSWDEGSEIPPKEPVQTELLLAGRHVIAEAIPHCD